MHRNSKHNISYSNGRILVKKQKTKLIITLSVALLSVLSMGVSTFAWFQANANVDIRAVSDSTTITVSKPDDYSFYAYNGNGSDSYSPPVSRTFASEFTQISSGSPLTSLTGMGPGQRMLFAVKFTDVTSMTFAVKTITSNNSTNEGITKRKVAESSPEVLINIGWAINIYTIDSYDADGAGYVDFLTTPGTDKFQVSAASDANGWDVNRASKAAQSKIDYGVSPKNIFTKGDATARSTYYVFYMVEFEDNTSNYYKEVSADNAEASTLDFPTPNASARWFVKDDNSEDSDGNSNCYAGLTFAINEIVVTKNGETVAQR